MLCLIELLHLAFGVIGVMPVLGPNTLVFLLLDGDLDRDIVTLFLVLLGAILLGHLVAFRHIDVMTRFVRDFGTLLFVVVRRLTFFGVGGGTLLFLFIGALLLVRSFTMLLMLISTFFLVFGLAFGDFVLLLLLLLLLFPLLLFPLLLLLLLLLLL